MQAKCKGPQPKLEAFPFRILDAADQESSAQSLTDH